MTDTAQEQISNVHHLSGATSQLCQKSELGGSKNEYHCGNHILW